jgi:hypothetical protein
MTIDHKQELDQQDFLSKVGEGSSQTANQQAGLAYWYCSAWAVCLNSVLRTADVCLPSGAYQIIRILVD